MNEIDIIKVIKPELETIRNNVPKVYKSGYEDGYEDGNEASDKLINEIVGNIEDLTTTDKTNLVVAINEIKAEVGDINDLSEVVSPDNRGSLIQAINDVAIQHDGFVRDAVSAFNYYDSAITKLTRSPETTIPTTLQANIPYDFGVRDELTLSFPRSANRGDVVYISFLSDVVPTNLTVDTTNSTDFDLVPEAHTGYEIYAKYNKDLEYWIVKYSDYSIEGM